MASYAENGSIWGRHHDYNARTHVLPDYDVDDMYGSSVNQGGNASPTLFRTYLADIGEYLTKHVGLCITDTIAAHLLWTDDEEQLNGLQEFCSINLMIVNELKAKVLAFGTQLKANVHFNGKHVEQGDIYSQNYDYLSGQSHKAMFSIKNGWNPLDSSILGYKATCLRILCAPSYFTAVTSGV